MQPAQRQDEVFDVVNERDEVIGQATRREVHARKLWHRAVHVLVFDRDGRIFLQKRSMAKDTAPGQWAASCSGHVDAGEDYATAAVRELREEIGLAVAGSAALKPLLRLTPAEETGWEFLWIYRTESEGPFVLNPSEVERGDWFSAEALNQAMQAKPGDFALSFAYIWKRLAKT